MRGALFRWLVYRALVGCGLCGWGLAGHLNILGFQRYHDGGEKYNVVGNTSFEYCRC